MGLPSVELRHGEKVGRVQAGSGLEQEHGSRSPASAGEKVQRANGRRGQQRRSQAPGRQPEGTTGGALVEPLALRGARGAGAGRPESRGMRGRNAQPGRGGAGGHASVDARPGEEACVCQG
jgi:hypothetical protein